MKELADKFYQKKLTMPNLPFSLPYGTMNKREGGDMFKRRIVEQI